MESQLLFRVSFLEIEQSCPYTIGIGNVCTCIPWCMYFVSIYLFHFSPFKLPIFVFVCIDEPLKNINVGF